MISRPLNATYAVYTPRPLDRRGFRAQPLPITLPRSKGMRDPLTGNVMHVMVPSPTPSRAP